MKTKLLLIAIVIIAAGLIGWGANRGSDASSVRPGEPAMKVTLHKSATCGCCEVYGSYMRKKGYEVIENNTLKTEDIKRSLGVPDELWSCHTSEIDGYVVEGHVPNEAIERLLSERPNIRGIGMAGMPSGSPGMPGPKETFLIYEINKDGTRGDLFMQI